MKNEIGFAERYEPKPDYYKQIGYNWNAVYLTEDDKEFHIELVTDFFNHIDSKEVEVLQQNPESRIVLGKYPSVRQAINKIQTLI